MPETTYNQATSEIKTLISGQFRLLEEMATLIRKKTIKTKPRIQNSFLMSSIEMTESVVSLGRSRLTCKSACSRK